MMAISVEHLGAQVQCPHCAAVVQTPPRSVLGPLPGPDPQGAAVQPPQPQYQPPAYQPPQYNDPAIHGVPERESIFTEPDAHDPFGGSPEMPDSPYQPESHAPSVAMEEPAEEPEEDHARAAAMQRVAQARKSGNLAPTILTFLIPYAICCSGFIAYLLVMWPSINEFEWLNDPKPNNKPRSVRLPKHDLDLPAKLKTPLGNTVRVGHMEITPIKVAKVHDDLLLEFKAKNISTNQIIKPIEQGFFFEAKASDTARPYTFLEEVGNAGARVYGGDLRFIAADKHPGFDGELKPGEECTIELTTGSDDKTRGRVASLLADNGKYRWRIQFRR